MCTYFNTQKLKGKESAAVSHTENPARLKTLGAASIISLGEKDEPLVSKVTEQAYISM